MTAPKTRFPIESFGPELTATLLKGSREKVTIPVANKRQGHRLQMRLNMLRNRMLKLDRPEHKIAARCRISLLWGAKAGFPERSAKDMTQPALVVISPHDSEFREIIEKAGVSLSEHEGGGFSPSTLHPPSELSDLLNELEQKDD